MKMATSLQAAVVLADVVPCARAKGRTARTAVARPCFIVVVEGIVVGS
jgi:hypothetical protein